jgi:hypothetical protein
MYYEEKMINGILHFRSSHQEEFKPFLLSELSKKVKDLEDELENKEIELQRALYHLNSRRAIAG